MKVIGLEAMTVPSMSSSSTVRPWRSCVARSSGTLMYASRPSGASIVVINVDGVTRSPCRTSISPMIPSVGAVTR